MINGGLAFPTSVHPSSRDGQAMGGMSLRDWFAGQIVAGLTAYSGSFGSSGGPGELAARAYQIADAMLESGGHS